MTLFFCFVFARKVLSFLRNIKIFGFVFKTWLFVGDDFEMKFATYPAGEKDAVEISYKDMELLEPKKWLNDNIIGFELRYIQNTLRPQERKIHLFDTYFLESLRRRKDSRDQRRRLVQHVDLLNCELLIVPVNVVNSHWFLMVVCLTEAGRSVQVMDSCALTLNEDHRNAYKLILSFLEEEWETENKSSLTETIPLRVVQIPQQNNSFDCGLFMLRFIGLICGMTVGHFLELTLMDTTDRPVNADALRDQLRTKLQQLNMDQGGLTQVATCDKKCRLSELIPL